MPKIDIVIPTYNRSNYLKSAIDSVLKQTCQEFDLYILDNCSNDNTREVVESFSSDKIKYIVNESNLGMVGNWNRALETGNNDLLNIFHDDDMLEPDFVSKVLDFYDKHSDVIFLHTAVTIIDNENKKIKQQVSNYSIIMSGLDFFILYLKKGVCVICPSVVIDRSKIPSNVYFDTSLPFTADLNFWIRISKFGMVGYINERLLRYRRHEESTSASLYRNFEIKIQDRFHYKNFLELEILSRGVSKSYLSVSNSYIARMLLADIWWLRLYGTSLKNTFRKLSLVVNKHISVIKSPQFWLTILKIFIPLTLLHIVRTIKNRIKSIL
jgi:glycosyltransferase involved in cell wall biosynthesis